LPVVNYPSVGCDARFEFMANNKFMCFLFVRRYVGLEFNISSRYDLA